MCFKLLTKKEGRRRNIVVFARAYKHLLRHTVKQIYLCETFLIFSHLLPFLSFRWLFFCVSFAADLALSFRCRSLCAANFFANNNQNIHEIYSIWTERHLEKLHNINPLIVWFIINISLCTVFCVVCVYLSVYLSSVKLLGQTSSRVFVTAIAANVQFSIAFAVELQKAVPIGNV